MGIALSTLLSPGTWVGRRIGNYLLEAVIGEGGMGAVYYAAKIGDSRFHRAVKVPRGAALLDAGQLARFRREADVHHLVSGHKNILALHEIGSDEDCEVPYMVMDYVEGATLAQLIRTANVDIPVRACVHLAIQVLSALAHAHDLGVMHKDIDPSNVMLGCDGGARLFDWGVASGDDFEKLTRTGQVVGKFGYMAPELVRGEAYGVDTDLFGVGVLLYEMLTLSKAFPIDDKPIIQVIQEVGARQLPAVRRAGVPPALAAAIVSLTHPDRRLRPRGAVEAIDMLDSAVSGYGATAEADLRTLACAFAPPENFRTGRYSIYLPPLVWKSVSTGASSVVADQPTAMADNRDGIPIAICDRPTEAAIDDSVPVIIHDRPTEAAIDDSVPIVIHDRLIAIADESPRARRAAAPTLLMPHVAPAALVKRTSIALIVVLASLVALAFAVKAFW